MAYTGVNIRQTIDYVTDGAGYTYSLGETYPTTRAGQTFGWSVSSTANARNRFAGYGPIVAGIVFQTNTGGATRDFTLDLPSPGTYRIRLCAGDFTSAQNTKIVVKDTSTVLTTINAVLTSAQFVDATGVVHADAVAYNANNNYIELTFATSKAVFTIGGHASGTAASILSSVAYELVSGGDVTAPTLTSPDGIGGAGSCTGSVVTNEANGTLYAVVTTSSSLPTAAQVKAGQDSTGAAALRFVSQAVTATGIQNIASGSVSSGTRYFQYMHEDAAGNQSAVVSSASFIVTSGDTTAPTMTGSITVGTVTTTSIQISWLAASDNVAVTSYEVSSNGGSSYTDIGDVLIHNFTGLTVNTLYNLRVRAKDAVGNVSTPLSLAQSTNNYGTITSEVLKDNTGTVLASIALSYYAVYNDTTGALVVRKTGLSTNGSGVVSFTDPALTVGVMYKHDWETVSGHRRMPRKAAS